MTLFYDVRISKMFQFGNCGAFCGLDRSGTVHVFAMCFSTLLVRLTRRGCPRIWVSRYREAFWSRLPCPLIVRLLTIHLVFPPRGSQPSRFRMWKSSLAIPGVAPRAMPEFRVSHNGRVTIQLSVVFPGPFYHRPPRPRPRPLSRPPLQYPGSLGGSLSGGASPRRHSPKGTPPASLLSSNRPPPRPPPLPYP